MLFSDDFLARLRTVRAEYEAAGHGTRRLRKDGRRSAPPATRSGRRARLAAAFYALKRSARLECANQAGAFAASGSAPARRQAEIAEDSGLPTAFDILRTCGNVT